MGPVVVPSATLASMSLGELQSLVNVIAWVKQRSTSDNHHLFYTVRLYAKDSMFQLRAMIDSRLPYNLISQDFIAQHRICGVNNDILPARDINGGGIRLYCRHSMGVESQGTDGSTTLDGVTTFGANILGCKMILGLPWLRTARRQIFWVKNTVLFLPKKMKPFTEEATSLRARVTGVHNISAAIIPSSCQDFVDPASVVAVVDAKKFVETCCAKGFEAYLVEWRDVQSPSNEWGMESVVRVIYEDDAGGKKKKDLVVFPAQYANFADVFDKRGADVLPAHTHHDLAIETEDNKVLSFGPTYNHSRLKLEVLREYINEMLAKGFIVPSKSLSGAPVLFTKKNDGGLRMCVDF